MLDVELVGKGQLQPVFTLHQGPTGWTNTFADVREVFSRRKVSVKIVWQCVIKKNSSEEKCWSRTIKSSNTHCVLNFPHFLAKKSCPTIFDHFLFKTMLRRLAVGPTAARSNRMLVDIANTRISLVELSFSMR